MTGRRGVQDVGQCVISDFRREVGETCYLLGHYAASSGNFLPTFRFNLSVPSSGVINYHYSLRNNTESHLSRRRTVSISQTHYKVTLTDSLKMSTSDLLVAVVCVTKVV
jgi:hypothetical protein